MDTVDHVYVIEIKASPERVWRAITDGDDTVRYYFDTRVASDWTPGSSSTYAYEDGSIAADGAVIEIDAGPSRRHGLPPALGPDRRPTRPGPHDLARRGGRRRGRRASP